MLKWLFGRSLDSALSETKKVRINGVNFKIKRIDVLNYLDGSNVMAKVYDLYAKGKVNEVDEVSQKKVKKFLSEILVAGVVSPKLSFKEEPGHYCVDGMFTNMELVNELYIQIMEFTYGKKKVYQKISVENGLKR